MKHLIVKATYQNPHINFYIKRFQTFSLKKEFPITNFQLIFTLTKYMYVHKL